MAGPCFFIIEAEDKRIITDPFNADYGYPLTPVTADIVTVSHDHWDHNAVETIDGQPQIIMGLARLRLEGISIKGIASYHDRSQGRERGHNTIFKISAEGLNLVHLGGSGTYFIGPAGAGNRNGRYFACAGGGKIYY